MSSSDRPRVFSGIQPSGAIHLGNYLGAVRNWVAMQDDHDAVYCIVDLHALTLPKEPGEVRQGTIDAARLLLAAGIDPERSVFFVQSHVSEHSELGWLAQTIASFGELSRMTQFKDKSERSGFVSGALFTYPALQAADILLYDTDIVPVGDDQRQHIELARDVAERINSRYGEGTVVVPEHRIPPAGARVMDLQHPENKMSKSVDSPQGTIGLLDTPSQITKKIKRAVTDNDGEVRYDRDAKPGVSNLLDILAAATGGEAEALAANYTQYGPLKGDAAEAVVAMIEPIQARHEALSDDDVIDALRVGASKASAIAGPVWTRVREAVGLLV
ncbi:MAG: tryptophan--tRNA ligase [Acidimicrobiales bacterium]